MSPLIGELSSPLRYLLVPLLILVWAVMLTSRQEVESRLSDTPGARPAAPGDVTVDAAPAAGERLAPQGGAAGDDAAVGYQRLKPGECFDIDRAEPGTVVRRGCDRPHDAQLVTVVRLVGELRTDREVRDAAAALCREPLHRKAAGQPRGTRWTTFVQYPYRSGYLLGSDTVACSLSAYTRPGTTARPLTAPLL
ncbi:hypothetical protein ABZ946_34490 [Streptomyces sp. NPDC046324]|uniref:hypothetical protein n=1 Tax=Streptomyces sp. NPDC046324 TaxID=3154915 RepID=UPI0033D68A1A